MSSKPRWILVSRILRPSTCNSKRLPHSPRRPSSSQTAGSSSAIPVCSGKQRERLYELNFDPGAVDSPIGGPARQAVREFEQANKLASTGEITQGLLRRLRNISGLKPWGTIVYSRASNKWGMAWSQDTRKAAVASARTSCGDRCELACD